MGNKLQNWKTPISLPLIDISESPLQLGEFKVSAVEVSNTGILDARTEIL